MSLVRRLKSLLQEHLLDMVRFSVALLCSQMHTLLSPLYTKTLEVEDYGQLELIFTLIGLISILLSMGLHQLIGVKFYKVDKKADEIYKVTIIYLLLSLPILLIIFIPSVSEVAGKLLINRQGENELVVLIFIIAHITFFRFFLLSILSASFRTRSYMMLELLVNALYLLLIVIMLISEMLTLHTIVYCILASNIPVAIYYAVYYFKYKTSISTGIFFSVKRSVLPTLRESLPFLGIGITAWVINLMDRWMILVITNDEATLGVYSLAYRLAGMVPLFMTFLVSNMYNRKLYRDLSNQKIDNGVLFKQHNKNLFVYIAVLLIVLPITGISINSMSTFLSSASKIGVTKLTQVFASPEPIL